MWGRKMFDMTEGQKAAFSHATGVDAIGFSHLIFFSISVLTLIWACVVILGIGKDRKRDMGEKLFCYLWVGLVVAIIGMIVYYT